MNMLRGPSCMWAWCASQQSQISIQGKRMGCEGEARWENNKNPSGALSTRDALLLAGEGSLRLSPRKQNVLASPAGGVK